MHQYASSGQKEFTTMRFYIFKSETNKELQAFAGDQIGSMLPKNHGPWKVTGIVGPSSAPPHNISRVTIEDAIASQGFQLWRMKRAAADA
jgi:hypothetical protein